MLTVRREIFSSSSDQHVDIRLTADTAEHRVEKINAASAVSSAVSATDPNADLADAVQG